MTEILSRWFWLVFLAMIGINTLIFRQRARVDLGLHPERRGSYRRLLWGYLFWFSLPAIAAGGIILCGGAATLFQFSQPAVAGPAVAGWHLLLIILWFLLVFWIFGNGGAEELADHPAFLSPSCSTPNAIRAWTAVAIAGGVMAELAMWNGVFRFM